MRACFVLALSLVGCGGGTVVVPERPPEPPPPIAVAEPEPAPEEEDPYLWLEDVGSERALDWVRSQNAISQGELEGDPSFEPLRARLLGILDSEDRIPGLTKLGPHYYNFWRDAQNPRGLWRRTSLAEYRRAAPRWETVIDLDALATAENENWVWRAASCEYPDAVRCLIMLSRGGADAMVVREFDTRTKSFVDGGFTLPEAKGQVSWIDRDHIYVATDFGAGTLTRAGYPRQVRRWRRGTPLAEAEIVREGTVDDTRVQGWRVWSGGRQRDFTLIAHSFYSRDVHVLAGDRWVPLEKPDDAEVTFWGDRIILRLRTDWTIGDRTFSAGSLLLSELEPFLAGDRDLVTLFAPSDHTALSGFTTTQHRVIVTVLEDVQTRLYAFQERRGEWARTPIHAEVAGTQSVYGVDDNRTDEYWHWVSDYLAPNRYSLGDGRDRLRALKSEPTFFDASGLVVTQHFTTSRDGTRVPYFQVSRESPDPNAPTLLFGYGGFEIPMLRGYNALAGAGWLEQGGIFAVANIRGGGEYGPRWHQAALRRERQRAYDDFIAVAEDLIARGVTTSARLGIQGGSNGGLLTGVMFTQRPELFGAVVCQVPLLDMRRFHLLLAGHSWIEEYGDPDDPEDWAALARFSPYQNLRPGVRYPPVLFTSSTRDDRVHPGHARKMVARMLETEQPVLYYENIEGGHGGAANNAQRAYVSALSYTFLRRRLR